MLHLRMLFKSKEAKTEKAFAVPYPAVLRIDGDTMTILVECPYDQRRKREMTDSLERDWNISRLGVAIEDLAGRSSGIWEYETWQGHSRLSDSGDRHLAEGVAADLLMTSLQWELKGTDMSQPGLYNADKLLQGLLKCELPFHIGYNSIFERFSAWEGWTFSSLEKVGSYLLDKSVEMMRANGYH